MSLNKTNTYRRKMREAKNVGQLYSIKNEAVSAGVREIDLDDEYQRAMDRFGYGLVDVPEREYKTGDVFPSDLEGAREAARVLTRKTGRKHKVIMIDLGYFKVVEA